MMWHTQTKAAGAFLNKMHHIVFFLCDLSRDIKQSILHDITQMLCLLYCGFQWRDSPTRLYPLPTTSLWHWLWPINTSNEARAHLVVQFQSSSTMWLTAPPPKKNPTTNTSFFPSSCLSLSWGHKTPQEVRSKENECYKILILSLPPPSPPSHTQTHPLSLLIIIPTTYVVPPLASGTMR